MIETCIEHTLLRIELRRLLQISYLQIATIDDITAFMSLLIHQNRHQGRLSRAITCHESHLLSFSDREGNLIKKNLRTKSFGEVLYV